MKWSSHEIVFSDRCVTPKVNERSQAEAEQASIEDNE